MGKKTGLSRHGIVVIKKSDIFTLLCLIAYRVLLDVIYIKYVSVRYTYYHFNMNYDLDVAVLSYLFMFCVIWAVPGLFRRGKLADVVLGLLILLYFIPYTCLFAYNRHDLSFALFVLSYFLLLILFDRCISFRNIHFKGIRTGIGETKLFVFLIIVLGLVRIVTSGYYTGFRVNFDLSEYYELRAEAREYAMPNIVRYLLGWSTTGMTIGLVYSLIKKKWGLSIFAVACTVLAFSYNGKKSILFMMLLTIWIALFFKEKHLKRIPAAFLLLSAVGTIELFTREKEVFICKHFIRRLLFIPPNMGLLHFDFFSSHEFDLLRSSVLRRFGLHSPYAAYGSIPRLIGAQYFRGQSMAMNANTGLCGDAFANFGFQSLLFAPLVIMLTFKALEWCAQHTDRRVQMAAAVFIAYSFENGSYFTLLLTNGMLFLMLLLSFLNGRKEHAETLA